MQPMVVLIELSSLVGYGQLTTFFQVLANATESSTPRDQQRNGK